MTSVCTGSLILGAAGLLARLSRRLPLGLARPSRLFGAEPVAERVVFDRNRVTGGGVTAGIDFALALTAAIRGEDHARLVQLALEYDPAPPFNSGSPERAGEALLAAYQRADGEPRRRGPRRRGIRAVARGMTTDLPTASSRPIRRAAPGRCRSGAASSASGRGPRSTAGRSRRSACPICAARCSATTSTSRSIPTRSQRVLLDNAANYVKPDIVKTLLKPTIGRGLLSSDGALWRDQRRIVAANFAPGRDRRADPGLRRRRAAGDGWLDRARATWPRQATATTMRIIADSLFAGDPRLTTEAAMDHITAALEGVSEARLQAMLGLPLMPWSLRGRRARRGQVYLARDPDRRWSATACPTAAPTISSAA